MGSAMILTQRAAGERVGHGGNSNKAIVDRGHRR